MAPRWRMLGWLASAELLAMAVWFSATAVVPQLTSHWQLAQGQQAWLTIAVQAGFVCGALASALLNLPDVMPAHRLFAVSALAAAALNALLTWPGVGWPLALTLRLATGVCLAGVYPTGMKLLATWFERGRGLALGTLVGALAIGSALPHLMAAAGQWAGAGSLPPWQGVLLAASAAALLAAAIAVAAIRPGPYLPPARRFDWRQATCVITQPGVRWANLGYLGHMWELYAMWTWAPVCLAESYHRAGWSPVAARLCAFGMVAGGALGCVLAGAVADRWGRVRVTVASLVVSGGTALVAGHLTESPGWLTVVCLVWGLAVVADSAQFSAAISELCDPSYVGTALTIQTCTGFLLTTLTIGMVPALRDHWGWTAALSSLAIGPAVGIASMLWLARIVKGNRPKVTGAE